MINKTVFIILIVCTLFLSLFSGCINQDQSFSSYSIVVSSDGSADVNTISEALDLVSTGDSIFVRKGVYKEHVTINTSVDLIGEHQASTIIDGEGVDSVIIVNAEYVNITGFTIRGSGSLSTYYKMDAGIQVNGFYSTITQCKVIDNTVGIQINNSNSHRLSDNMLENNSYGMHLFYASLNHVANNTFENNRDYGCYAYTSANRNEFVDNVFVNNKYALRIKAEDNQVIRNYFKDNKRGIWFCCGAKDNIAYHNTVLNSTDKNGDANFMGNLWYDPLLGGNYWGDYAGVDDDGDGFGDTPYIVDEQHDRLPRNITDELPLMKPIINYENAT